MAISNKSGLKSGSLIKVFWHIHKWEWKLFLPLQCKSNDIKKACLTRDSSSLDSIYKMYLRIFWLIVIFKGKRPSSALQVILEALLCTSKYRLQNWRCAFWICEPSQVLKSGLAYCYTPQISLLFVRIGEIIVSNILQARAAFSLLRFVCRLELKRAWRAFSLRCSRDTEKFPDEDVRVPK